MFRQNFWGEEGASGDCTWLIFYIILGLGVKKSRIIHCLIIVFDA